MRDVVKLTLIPGDMSKCAKRKYDCDSSQTLRSDVSKFCFHTDCYLCGEWVDQEKIKRHPHNNDYEFSRVMLIQVKATITKICAERRADKVDEWADVVSHRLSCIYDMPAEEAIYHRRCYQYFMSPHNLKLDAPSTTTGGMVLKKRGRPSVAVDQEKKSTFMHVIEYMANNDDETALCALWLQSLDHIIKTAATYRHPVPECQAVNSRSTSQLNDDSKDMDSLQNSCGQPHTKQN